MSLLEDENQTMEDVGVEENAQILIEGANCSDIYYFLHILYPKIYTCNFHKGTFYLKL